MKFRYQMRESRYGLREGKSNYNKLTTILNIVFLEKKYQNLYTYIYTHYERG